MNLKNVFYRSGSIILRIIELQTFITLISLPILISWGLPVSLMTILSTPLFSPLFTLFLLLSSVIFFMELLGIPYYYLTILLEKVSYIWIYILKQGRSSWLIGFAQPSTIILFLIVIITILILCTQRSQKKRTVFLSIFLISSCIFVTYNAPKESISHIEYANGTIPIIFVNKKVCIIDPGILSKKPINNSWIQYTLIPFIITKTGATEIHSFIGLHLNHRTLEAIESIHTIMPIKNVYIPSFKGKLLLKTYRQLQKSKRLILESEGRWFELRKNSFTLLLSAQAKLQLTQIVPKQLYHNAEYNPVSIEYFLDLSKTLTIEPIIKH